MIGDNYEPVKIQGDNSTVEFSFNFPIIAEENLKVYSEDVDTGVQTLITAGITIEFDDSVPAGTVTFDEAPTDEEYVVIGREISPTQTVDYKTSSGFQGSVVMRSFDKLTAIIQDALESISRAIKLPLGSSISVIVPEPEDNKALVWDGVSGAMKNSTVDVGAIDEAVDACEEAKDAAQLAQAAAEEAAASIPDDIVAGDGTANPTNLLANGDFEAWSAGASAAPDGWTTSGAGVAVAREGTIIKSGTYSIKVTRNGANCQAIQSIHATKGIAYWKGRIVTLSCWVYATVASRARIYIDGVGAGTGAISYSSYHSGNSTWELLKVTTTVASDATLVTCGCRIDTGDTSAYFDGAMLVEGESAFAFSPKPAEEGVWSDYSAVSTIVGWASFTSKSVYTKKIGNICFFNILISGASNATTAQITFPYNIALPGISAVALINDNGGARSAGLASGVTNSVLNFYKDLSATAFTNSGTKTVNIQGSFVIA